MHVHTDSPRKAPAHGWCMSAQEPQRHTFCRLIIRKSYSSELCFVCKTSQATSYRVVSFLVLVVVTSAPRLMADKPTDPLWDHSSLWNDLGNDHGGSLIDMIPDAEHMLHMLPDAPGHEQKGADIDCEEAREGVHSGDVGDDGGDMEPPTKLHASKPDSQTARTKAYREKQRRAQLNNRYGSAVSM